MPSSFTGAERLATLLVKYQGMSVPPWSLLKYLSPDDFKHPTKQHPVALLYWDCLRWEATRLAGEHIALIITDDFRPTGDKASSHSDSPCTAIDCRAKKSRHRFFLLWAAFNIGIKRMGIYCDDHHLHFDISDLIYPEKNRPSEVAWIRECES